MGKDKAAIRVARDRAVVERNMLQLKLDQMERIRIKLQAIHSEVEFELKDYDFVRSQFQLAGRKYKELLEDEKQLLKDFSSDFDRKRNEVIPLLDARLNSMGNRIASLQQQISMYDMQL